MANETIKVLQIDTDPAVKSLKDLRNELKGFKDQMANLEEGSDAFLEIANKAGEVKHQIDEINESIKGASADFGDMVGNVTNVTAGIVGAFEAVAGGLQAMGVESAAVDETIKRMQGLMAVVQGLSSIDDGIKSFDKLTKAIQGSTGAMKVFKAISNPVALAAVAAVVVAIGAAWNKFGDSIRESIPALDKFIKKLDGTAAKEAERLAEAQKRYNEELAVSNEEVAKILEQRKLDAITPEARESIKKYKDDIKILENQILQLQGKMNDTNHRPTWEGYRDEALALMEQVRLLKHEIDDLYTNPKYQLSNQKPAEIKTPINREQPIPIETKIVPTIAVEEIPTESLEDMGRRIGNIIAQAQTKAYHDKWVEEMNTITESGNLFFEQLKSTMDSFGDSSLGLSSGWIASLDQFQLAFQQTMDIVKDEGTVGWEAYGNVAATALGGIGSMLNALSQEQDVSTKEGFEQQKKLQIGATVMNMLSGIMAAWTSSMALPAPASFIVGGIQTAATAALGAAQIAKIKSQTMNSAMASGAIQPSAVNSMIIPPVQYSSAVQGASTEGAIKDTKVYVTETDIKDTMSKVDVQESENTY